SQPWCSTRSPRCTGRRASGTPPAVTIPAAAVALAATGPGRFSLDRAIGCGGSLSGPWWGVGVLGRALLVSAPMLASHRIGKPALRDAPPAPKDVPTARDPEGRAGPSSYAAKHAPAARWL